MPCFAGILGTWDVGWQLKHAMCLVACSNGHSERVMSLLHQGSGPGLHGVRVYCTCWSLRCIDSGRTHVAVLLAGSTAVLCLMKCVCSGAYGMWPQDRNREAERFEAAWTHKSAVGKGIAMFNSRPVKGVKYMIEAGLIAERVPQVWWQLQFA